MKLVYTDQALESLKQTLEFISNQGVTKDKVLEIRDLILSRSESLAENPYLGQKEEYLHHLNLEHRRLIVEYCKIIYRVENDVIYVTDVFDTRQDPHHMKG